MTVRQQFAVPESDPARIREALDAMFDMPLVRHGFTDYNRDYEIDWQIPTNAAGPDAGRVFTYRFRAYTEAHYDGWFHASMFPLDDVFIDYERWVAAGEPEGFVWGVKWADHYPGASYIDSSERAAAWSGTLSVPMHEVSVVTNTFTLSLVFHDLVVAPAAAIDTP